MHAELTESRAMILRFEIRDSRLMTLSIRPADRYASSGSVPTLTSGITAMEEISSVTGACPCFNRWLTYGVMRVITRAATPTIPTSITRALLRRRNLPAR
jgi:hypothetical protein